MRLSESRLYVFFGRSCAGKSFVAAAFARHVALPWIEGDAHLTEAMKQCIAAEQPFTDAIRDEYYDALSTLIGDAPLVLAQAFFKRRHRLAFRSRHPGSQFVHVTAPDGLVAERAAKRTGHRIARASYVLRINALFEPPHDEEVVEYENVLATVDVAALASALRR